MSVYSYIGSGAVYAAPFGGGKMRKLGHCTQLEMAVSQKVKELHDWQNSAGGVVDSLRRIEKVAVAMTITELSPENLAMAVFGASSQTTSGAVANESVTAWLGGLVRLSHIQPAGVTVTSSDGETAPDWLSSTAYVAGDYVIPTTPNQHYYKCTTSGTSGGSEPTWPVSGTTITDGSAQWQDMGTIIRVEGSDFELTGAGLFIPETSAMEEGRTIDVDYSYGSEEVVQALINSGTELTMVFDGLNEAQDDRPRVVDLHRVRFGPTSGHPLVTDGFASLTLSGILLKDTNQSGEGVSQYFKETLAA
ncbi:MAG: hypothetical protein HQL52_20160 [Magnetococcales bacterium]|nr:hypothetical protein [Magnetococcales bacterium]